MHKVTKSVIILSIFIFSLPAMSGNKNPWGDCGIGAMVFPKTRWAAVISNVIWDWGTTASSSTSSSEHLCEGKSASAAKFINETYANLEEETAVGAGEHLTTMLNTLGCKTSSHKEIIDSVRVDFSATVKDPVYSEKNNTEKAQTYYMNVMNKVEGKFADQCNSI